MAEAQRLRAAIIVISETASKDASTDKCIPALQGVFADEGGRRFEADDTAIVTDDVLQIQRAVTQRSDGDDFVNLVVTSGGTGFTQKDVTPEVCLSLSFSLSSCFINKTPSPSALLVLKTLSQRVTES
jgi:gephyrin